MTINSDRGGKSIITTNSDHDGVAVDVVVRHSSCTGWLWQWIRHVGETHDGDSVMSVYVGESIMSVRCRCIGLVMMVMVMCIGYDGVPVINTLLP